MQNDNQAAIKEMLKSFAYLLDEALKKTTKTYEGIVLSATSDSRKWNVKYNNEIHAVKIYGQGTPTANMMVKVIVPQGNQALAWFFVPGGGGGTGDGATFYPSVSEEGIISWTNDKGLPNPAPVDIKGPQGIQGEQGEVGATGPQGPKGSIGPQGPQGPKGPAGKDGADGAKGDTGPYFTPSVNTDGDLSWTNNGNLLNPSTVNIKGPKGIPGTNGEDGIRGLGFYRTKLAPDRTEKTIAWSSISTRPSDNIMRVGDMIVGTNGNGFVCISQSTYTSSGSINVSYRMSLRGPEGDIGNVKNFGAVGDGVTDDTNAIQTAINETQFGTVFFPEGDYKMSAPVTLKREVSIVGASKNGVRLLANAGAFIIVPEFGTSMSNMTIIGNGTGVGINLNGTGQAPLRVNDVEIDNLYIQNYDFGVRASWAWNVKITRSDIFNCGNAIKIIGTSVNNMVSDCVLNNAGKPYSVVSFEQAGGNSEGWMFSNCFIGYGSESFNIYGSLAVQISNCILDLNTGNAITVTGAHDFKLTNSWVYCDNGNGIQFEDLSVADDLQASITGCHIYAKNGYGIRLGSNGNKCSVVGNTFECGQQSIYIDFSGNHTIIGNTSKNSDASIINGANNNFEGNTNMTAVFPGQDRNTYQSDCAVVYNYYDAAPTAGTWEVGDKVFFRNVTDYVGAICISGGTPGTWKNFGKIY